MNRYFAVETKCGHVGKNRCIYIWFAVKAESGKEAAAKARGYKRVKRNHKDAIRQVREISFLQYCRLHRDNNSDAYLQCKNIQQQREIIDFEKRVEADEYLIAKMSKPTPTRNPSYLIKKAEIQTRDAIKKMHEDYGLTDFDDVAV